MLIVRVHEDERLWKKKENIVLYSSKRSFFYTVFSFIIQTKSPIMCNNPQCCQMFSGIIWEESKCNCIEPLVKMRKRFIQDKYLRIRYKHPSDCYTFALTTWKLIDWCIEKVCNLEPVYTRLEDTLWEYVSSKYWRKHNIFSCRTRLKKNKISKEYSDMFSVESPKSYILCRDPIKSNNTRSWIFNSGKYPKKCRLPTTRRSS